MLVKVVKSVIAFLARNRYFPIFNKWLYLILEYGLFINKRVIVSYQGGRRAECMALVEKIRSEVKFYVEPNEAYQIYVAVLATSKLKGDLAEVGVYQGGSAKIICEAKGDRILHLFDTFKGLPAISKEDQQNFFHEGEFSANLAKVKRYLRKYANVYFYKGIFR